jgi:hypothetical protein
MYRCASGSDKNSGLVVGMGTDLQDFQMLMNWCSFLEARIQEPMRITNVEATGEG